MCLAKASGIPKKCKEEAKDYLDCRMQKGLMAKQSMEELGFIPESSWEYEQMSKEQIAKTVQDIMRESRARVKKDYFERKNAQK